MGLKITYDIKYLRSMLLQEINLKHKKNPECLKGKLYAKTYQAKSNQYKSDGYIAVSQIGFKVKKYPRMMIKMITI